MNPRHFWFIFLGTVSVANAASTHVNAKLHVTVIHGGCDKNNDEGNSNDNEDNNIAISGIKAIGDGNNNNISGNNAGSIDTNDVQRISLTPGKNFLITVDPCFGPSASNVSGIPLNALKAGETKSYKPTTTIVPQFIVPASVTVVETPEDEDIQRLIDQQPDLNDLTLEQLNEQVLKFIEFVDLSREAGLNKLIKWPRLVFMGEDEDVKYKLIENLIGSKGILTPPESALKTTPRFAAAIRFTLKNDPNQEKLTFKIDGEMKENLFTALKETKTIKEAADKFSLSEKAVEVEISGKLLPSIVFIDLPWNLPTATATGENDQILAKLFEKYLRQPWNFTVAIGNGNLPFDQWKILKLLRTFDDKMRRIFTVSVNPPLEEDQKIRGLILGLQETLPILKMGKMYYLDTEATTDLAGKSRTFCSDVKCGNSEFIRGIQVELLRHWNANRPEVLRIIKTILEPLKTKISAYDGYWKEQLEAKWKALVSQSIPILHENLIFFSEDRDNSTCTGSSLDLIKESIFERSSSSPISGKKSKNINWSAIFSNYQNEISRLPRVPDSIDWTRVKSLISDLKAQGPNQEIISNLKRLVLKPQLATLQIPKSRLFDLIKIQLKEKVSRALESKISLESFIKFKREILKVAEKIFIKKFDNLNNLNNEIDEADEISSWFFNFPEAAAENSSFWLNLMKTESVDSALDSFRKTVEIGFIEICGRQTVLQPRLIIKNLLTRQVVQLIIEELEKTTPENKENLIKMSSESIEALKALQKRLEIYEKLIKF